MTSRDNITSDVPTDQETHEKKIHVWFEDNQLRLFNRCFSCKLNSDYDCSCPYFGEAQTLDKCKKYIKHAEEETTQTKARCGDCSAYKTHFCTFHEQEGYIKKGDHACSDFQFDRHLQHPKKPRRMSFERKVSNL